LYNDTDKGRIYRISRTNADKPQWTKGLNLGNATIEELIAKLEDKNIWWRQNAQRLLVDRKASESIEPLKKTVTSGNPMGRLHALWTLQGIDELTPEMIKIGLHDAEAGIRKNAIKLAELHLRNSPMLVQELLGLQSDPDPGVRFQLLCTLGFIGSDEAARAREALLFKDISDKWVQEAAMSASADPKNLTEIVINRMHDGTDKEQFVPLLKKLVAMLAASKRPGTSDLLLNYVQQAEERNQFAVEAGVFDGIAQALQHNSGGISFTPSQTNGILQKFFQTRSPEIRRSALGVAKAAKIKNVPAPLIKNALAIAQDTTQPEDMRVDAIDFLALQETSVHADVLKKFLVPQESLPIQLAALRTLSEIPNTSLAGYLVTNWQALTPELQDAAIRTFLTNDARIEILLTAIEDRKIPASGISWPRRVRLMSQRNDMLRDRSRAIFASGEKQDLSKKYQAALSERGTAEKGKIVFQKNCSLCHQVRGADGMAIGPDLGTIHNWSAEAILTHTLNPNLSISSGFDLWAVQLNNGESIQGIIASESPTAVTLRNVGAQDVTIHRNEIKSIKTLNMSIMPENLEEQISIQDMTDLLAFLKGR
jgi:putative heme-binding domain-containing protein